jgi:glycosyltransferase involved in cell wall biosynthesis
VDIEYFRAPAHQYTSAPEYKSPTTNHQPLNTIVFIGTMFWPPNVDGISWFAGKIWPLIKKQVVRRSSFVVRPKIQIIGQRPTGAIKELAKKDENIELIEYAEDIRPYMQKGKVFIVPLRQGSGMRVKILNAFASGIPVVSTSVGAEGIEGLHPVVSGSRPSGQAWLVNSETNHQPPAISHDFNIWIEDDPGKFAGAIIELLNNDELREMLSENARKLVEERYSWEIIGRRLIEVYSKVASTP